MKRALVPALVWGQLTWGMIPLAAAPAGHSPGSAQEAEKVGFVWVRATRAGTEIRLDGRTVGFTPLDTLKVSPGRHRLVAIVPDRTSWLDRDWASDIEVRPGETLKVEIVFERSYSINSVPYGAQVFVNGKVIGDTPAIVSLPDTASAADIILTKEGFLPDTLRLNEWSQRLIQVKLTRKPGAAIAVTFSGASAGELQATTKKWIYISAGAGVLTGLTALYFKRRADNTYDRYMKAIDPTEIERLYNRTKRFDDYAALSFVAFQVSFGSTLYFFLKTVNQ